MKKFISTKMIIFMSILLIGSITCFISAFIVLGNSGYKLSNYIDEFDNMIWDYDYHFSDYRKNFDKSEVIFSEDSSEIKNLDIALSNYFADIVTSDTSNNIEIVAEYDNNLLSTNLISANNTDGTLSLKAFTGLRPNDVYFRITIPTSYAGNLSIVTANGDINLSNLNSQKISLKSLNSDITLDNNTNEEINIALTNGSINLTQNSSKKLEIKSINSDMNINSKFEDIKIDNTNGEINIVIPNEMKNCYINNISDDITLQTNIDKGFELNFETVSGDFENNSTLTSYSSSFNKYKATKGNPDANINIKTVNGDLTIN